MKVRSLVDDIIKKTINITSPMIGMGNTTLIDGGLADESDDEELEFYETELNKLLSQKKPHIMLFLILLIITLQ
jgi:hypothetical protein